MPIAKTTPVDIALIASIAVSIMFSAVVVSKVVSNQAVNLYSTNADNSLAPALSGEQLGERPDTREPAPTGSGAYGGEYAKSPSVNDYQEGSGTSYSSQQSNLESEFSTSVYENAPYMLPITWGAVAGTLIWRGKVRSTWSSQGYDYETFRLVVRMRGSPIRVKLLNSVATAKNRLQLADELDVDWKTIDNHMEILTRSGLVQEKAIVGTTRYYVLTEHGRRILLLLANGEEPTSVPKQDTAVGALGSLNVVR